MSVTKKHKKHIEKVTRYLFKDGKGDRIFDVSLGDIIKYVENETYVWRWFDPKKGSGRWANDAGKNAKPDPEKIKQILFSKEFLKVI